MFIYTLTNFESRATVDVDFLLRAASNSMDNVKELITIKGGAVMKRTKTIPFIFIMLMLCFTGCGKNNANDNSTDVVLIDYYDVAKFELEEYIIGLNLPSCFDLGNLNDVELFDVTGDGNDDLCACICYGSGMTRDAFVAYDPVNHVGYILDSYSYSYRIGNCDENELVVIKYSSGNGKNYNLVGTIILKDGELVFIEKT